MCEKSDIREGTHVCASRQSGEGARVHADVGPSLCSVHKLRIKLEVYENNCIRRIAGVERKCGEKENEIPSRRNRN